MLPNVQRIRRGDRLLCYHRPTGIRLPDLPETHPEFVAAWARAESTKPDHAFKLAPGTIAQAVRNLRASTRWKNLTKSYQGSLRFHLERIENDHGALPVKGLREKHIVTDLAKLDPNPANASLKCWRLIFAQAKIDNAIDADPTAGIKKISTKSPGHASWSQAEIDIYRARWPAGTPQRIAFELLAWTGARVSDAAVMSRAHIGSDGLLTFRQQKTGGLAHVPWTSPLPRWAKPWEGERAAAREIISSGTGFTFLETAQGKARTVKGLSNLISAAAIEAKITGRSAHGLRKYRLSAIAEAGGSAHAIMSWGGHSSLSEAEAYTRAANRRAVVTGEEQEQNDVNAVRNDCKR
ncbi:tyrosine-type recombinase/integrase [Pseudogemmobacter sonorensis]|uniref:tyrosine-type recombinase/integrase n=1 Tax=Pseudogemmobacter sonorensis TaxID=2989681 RepID=UPI00368EC766